MSFALSVHASLISYIVNYATERARERCQIKTKGAEERTLKGEKEISVEYLEHALNHYHQCNSPSYNTKRLSLKKLE